MDDIGRITPMTPWGFAVHDTVQLDTVPRVKRQVCKGKRTGCRPKNLRFCNGTMKRDIDNECYPPGRMARMAGTYRAFPGMRKVSAQDPVDIDHTAMVSPNNVSFDTGKRHSAIGQIGDQFLYVLCAFLQVWRIEILGMRQEIGE